MSNSTMKARMSERVLAVVCAGVCLYVSGYYPVMARNCSAVRDGVVVFQSCYIFSANEDLKNAEPSPIHSAVGKVSIFNYVFCPADVVYYGMKRWMDSRR